MIILRVSKTKKASPEFSGLALINNKIIINYIVSLIPAIKTVPETFFLERSV